VRFSEISSSQLLNLEKRERTFYAIDFPAIMVFILNEILPNSTPTHHIRGMSESNSVLKEKEIF